MHPIFVGRQPIFDAHEHLVGFELLFRAGHRSEAAVTNGDEATSDLLRSAFVDIGLPHLVGPHLAFVNLTRSFLDDDIITSLPPEQVVLEILEDIEIDSEVVAAVQRLKQRGFRIALDDYQFQVHHSPLVALADIVKLDVLVLSTEALAREVETLRAFGVELLAEKVETAECYHHCQQLGFRYFQGYHLSHPHVIEGQRLESLEVALLKLLKTLQDRDPEPSELERLIGAEPDLAAQILRIANSPAYRAEQPTVDLASAIERLGQGRIRRIGMLLVLNNAAGPSAAVEQVMIRARMGMLLARACNLTAPECECHFSLGMLSGLDRVLGIPLRRILNELHLVPETEQALIEHKGPLAPWLETIEAFEGPANPPPAGESPVAPQVASRLYLESVRWTEDILDALSRT
ncbi:MULTISPECIES: EAL and HDOD domain-containing protein [unclassified Thioalkalivibrio]|uniref:EAL and HDOD domain-containing protein n=1 Tax=unclassified Thioalkalivibrio TaxID=2621013 RepID=UPI00036352E5|nr:MULTISPECIES: EAL domain-containing protein [unclassified Thioalkalivibrio]